MKNALEDVILCRTKLLASAVAARKQGFSASEWEEEMRTHCAWAVETLGDKELHHLVSYVWKSR